MTAQNRLIVNLALVAVVQGIVLPAAMARNKSDVVSAPATSGLLDCASAMSITCGDHISDNNSNGASNAANYSCFGNEIGPELVYELTLSSPTEVNIVLRPSTCDLDLFLLDACDEAACVASSNNGGSNAEQIVQALASGTFYVVVEGWNGAICDFELEVAGCGEGLSFTLELPDLSSFGIHASLAVGTGRPNLAHHDGVDQLRFSVKAGSAWTSESVTTSPVSGSFTVTDVSLALDPSGAPRIAHSNVVNGDLLYSQRNGGVWTTESVDGTAGDDVGFYVSLAVDAVGTPHIAYSDATNGAAKYARRDFGSWQVETFDSAPGGGAGLDASIALDAVGDPHVAHRTVIPAADQELRYARKVVGGWTTEIVESGPSVGFGTSLVLDAEDVPHLSYMDFSSNVLKYARKVGNSWQIETVAEAGGTGFFRDKTALVLDELGQPTIAFTSDDLSMTIARKVGSTWVLDVIETFGVFASLAQDPNGNLHLAYASTNTSELRYGFAFTPNFRINAPLAGAVWPVGSIQEIVWSSGLGSILDAWFNVSLSVDGGRTFDRIRDRVTSNQVSLRVPHAPTRFAQIKVEREFPPAVVFSDSFFTIDASITLDRFLAERGDDGREVDLRWRTTPGPDSEIGYRLERRAGDDRFVPLHTGILTGLEYHDAGAPANPRYRLIAVNGLGEELVMGAASPAMTPVAAIAASPLPYREGELHVVFATAGGLGGGPSNAAVSLYDVSGRLVRRLVQAPFEPGYHETMWDGRDHAGTMVPPGVYFLRSRSGGHQSTLKITVLR